MDELLEQLQLIEYYYRLSKDKWRTDTYKKAAAALATYNRANKGHILSGRQAKAEIRGIGDSIATDIDQFFETGKIERLEALEEQFRERKEVLDLFLTVFGIGTVTATALYDRGYRTLQDLWYGFTPPDGKRKQPPVLTEAGKLSVMYRLHLRLRIERAEIDLAREALEGVMPPGVEWVIAGSYRRGEPTSGDLDILVKNAGGVELSTVIDALGDFLVGDLTYGVVSYMGIYRLRPPERFNAHRVDISLVPAANWGAVLIHYTGSREFNILMRNRALDLGMTLNNYALKRLGTGETVPTPTEEEVFRILRVGYLAPEERTREVSALKLVR